MRYNNKRNFQKKDKYNKELGGMTVSVRQVKNKDGETVSDVNGALRVLKKNDERWVLSNLRERSHFTSKGEKKRKAKTNGRRRWLKKVEKRKLELGY